MEANKSPAKTLLAKRVEEEGLGASEVWRWMAQDIERRLFFFLVSSWAQYFSLEGEEGRSWSWKKKQRLGAQQCGPQTEISIIPFSLAAAATPRKSQNGIQDNKIRVGEKGKKRAKIVAFQTRPKPRQESVVASLRSPRSMRPQKDSFSTDEILERGREKNLGAKCKCHAQVFEFFLVLSALVSEATQW